MCLMCVEVAKGRMKITEARKALTELVETAKERKDLEHYRELSNMTDAELAQKVQESSIEVSKRK